jgi:hypothetical protein
MKIVYHAIISGMGFHHVSGARATARVASTIHGFDLPTPDRWWNPGMAESLTGSELMTILYANILICTNFSK